MILRIKFDKYQENVFSRKGTFSGCGAPIWCVRFGKALPAGVNSAYAKVRKESVRSSGFQGVHARKRADREPRRLSRSDAPERTGTDEDAPERVVPSRIVRLGRRPRALTRCGRKEPHKKAAGKKGARYLPATGLTEFRRGRMPAGEKRGKRRRRFSPCVFFGSPSGLFVEGCAQRMRAENTRGKSVGRARRAPHARKRQVI